MIESKIETHWKPWVTWNFLNGLKYFFWGFFFYIENWSKDNSIEIKNLSNEQIVYSLVNCENDPDKCDKI